MTKDPQPAALTAEPGTRCPASISGVEPDEDVRCWLNVGHELPHEGHGGTRWPAAPKRPTAAGERVREAANRLVFAWDEYKKDPPGAMAKAGWQRIETSLETVRQALAAAPVEPGCERVSRELEALQRSFNQRAEFINEQAARLTDTCRELEAARAELKLLRKVVLYADIESTRAKQAYDEWVNNA